MRMHSERNNTDFMTFGLASDRCWNTNLKTRLEKQLNCKILVIDKPAQLTSKTLEDRGVRTVFFTHWSHKIPSSIHENYECIIFHMTDVPYGRGGSPLQNLIVRGHESTVISAIQCIEEMDSGPIYLKYPLNLNGSAEEIFIRANKIIESMITEIIKKRPEPEPQQGQAVVFKRRQPEDSNWSDATNLNAVFDHIRMLDAEGYPKAFVDVGPFRLKFTRASRRIDAVEADVRIELRNDGDAKK